ncbi:MAG: CpaF family protein [Acidimicrobiales bacterium]
MVARELVELAATLRSDIARALAGDDTAARPGTSEPSIRARASALAQNALDSRASERVSAGETPLPRSAEDTVQRLALDMLFGLGGMQVFIDDPLVENIDVIGCDRAFVTYADGSKEMVGSVASSDDELIALIRNAGVRFGLTERRFDAGQPELDLRLPDGSRLSAVMAVTDRPIVDIRRHRLADHDLAGLVELGSLDQDLADFLAAAVRAKRNILVSGAMNSGKTTLLRALAAEVPPAERVVTIEQALELGLDKQDNRHPDCVAMEARLANTEGEGAIGMAQLVRRSLRMNASRVIVGEVLGDEVIPMLNAMSQGRSGSMGTIHADSSAGVFRRIAAYAVQSPERLPLEATNLLIAGAIHFVVHVDVTRVKGARPVRHVVSVREVVDAEGPLVISNEIWRPGPEGLAIPAAPLSDRAARTLAQSGYPQGPLRRAPWC